MEGEKLFYGITQDWKCVDFPETNEGSLKNNHDLRVYRYIIERGVHRLSGSGKTEYYRTKILNSDLKTTAIEYEGAKMWRISDEVWMNLGDFERDEVVVYWPGGESAYHDWQFFLYIDLLNWEILKEPSSFKVCLVEFEDCYGYKQSVKTGVFSSNDIEFLIKKLARLSEMRSYSAFKLTTLLGQISTFENLSQEQKERAKKFFSAAIEPEYKRCKEYYPNIFHDFDDLDEWYAEVRGAFFD